LDKYLFLKTVREDKDFIRKRVAGFEQLKKGSKKLLT